MNRTSLLIASLAGCALLFSQAPQTSATSTFLEKPYLQLGNNPDLRSDENLTLMWHTDNRARDFAVQIRGSADKNWRAQGRPTAQLIEAAGLEPHLVYRTKLTGLKPGDLFQYQVTLESKGVFAGAGKARRSATQPYRFALFGDCAQGTPGQRKIAFQVSKADPDFVFITGDIVYSAGRISEYRTKFFPVYSADSASPDMGAPLLQSVPFLAAPGNHDTAIANYGRFPDALAYFLYWDQPLNGPSIHDAPKTSHVLTGNTEHQPQFLAGAQSRYPIMANFSFTYGNSHWTVLDSNAYMDWRNPDLRAWVEKDLASASAATWRFVAFHHPGFNSSPDHFYDQWMRYLAPVFEKGNIDVVFAGHVHNYQRTFPLTFAPDGPTGPKGQVEGRLQLDKEFHDGGPGRKPHGVIYIVSGGGGASLYNPEIQGTPNKWQDFTTKYIADSHSFSSVEVNGTNFRLRQIAEDGTEVDRFQIAK